MKKGIIFDIKEFTIHDGPGIRTTVFMKGCPLHCLWCHNPEGISLKKQLMISQNGCIQCGKCYTKCDHKECQGMGRCAKICPQGLIRIVGYEEDALVLAERLRQQSLFFDGSGVTISGGEPTMQPEFLFELLEGLKGVHTVVETCGHTSEEVFKHLIEACSNVYLDIKHLNSEVHKQLTGVENEKIIRNLEQLIDSRKEFVIRVPLIPGCNDDQENMIELAHKLKGVKGLQQVEFLPYNPFTTIKYNMAQMEFKLKDVQYDHYTPSIPQDIYNKLKVPFRVL